MPPKLSSARASWQTYAETMRFEMQKVVENKSIQRIAPLEQLCQLADTMSNTTIKASKNLSRITLTAATLLTYIDGQHLEPSVQCDPLCQF